MDSNELSRENRKFFYVDLAMALMREDSGFDYILNYAARIQERREKVGNTEAPPEDCFGITTFQCQNGEVGYVQISGRSAKLIQDEVKDIKKLFYRIPRSIQGEHNDRCIITIDNIEISLRIIAYEGIIDEKLSMIEDPIDESVLDGTQLGRVVAILVSDSSKFIPEEELICAFGA